MKILIAIDGSHHSMAAIHALSRRAWPVGTEMILIHVTSGVLPAGEADEVEKTFEEAASILMLSRPDLFIKRQVVYGHCREAILDTAATWDADLVVMGCRGHSLLEDLLLGSVSQYVIEHARCPVMVAREVDPSAVGNVLVPVDDSESSAAAVEWLATQAWAQNATICLLSVATNREPQISIASSVKKASEQLLQWETERGLLGVAIDYWSRFLRERLPGATIHHGVVDGDPRDMIVRAANNWPAETVVMGSSGRKGFAQLLLGSVSQNVSANAHSSVEIVRGIPSQHFQQVHELVQQHREESPLLNEPSRQQYGSVQQDSPMMFFW
jgi:nucleotide-binding universal stress UspA family protein